MEAETSLRRRHFLWLCCASLIATYRSLDLGLVDSAVIATAERLAIRRVLTVDERDFRAVRPKGGALTLLPADSA